MMKTKVKPIPEGYQAVTPYLSVKGAAGAKLLRPVKDQFYGDRSGTLEDPSGHVWHVATHKEDIPPEELKKRAAAMAAAAEKA